MDVWLITVGEPHPFPGADVRLLRTGRLALKLPQRGHRVAWWSSDFDHFTKQRVAVKDREISLGPNLDLLLLHGTPYRTNLSPVRLYNHWQLGRAFARDAPRRQRPDVILCSFPTIELSLEATRYGAAANVPVILDVRDLWPDIFLKAVPGSARRIARFGLSAYFKAAREALASANGIIAVSDRYLEWGLAYAGRIRGTRDAVFPLGYPPLTSPNAEEVDAKADLVARGIDPTKRICWFIGTFGRTYDLGPVIQAARRLGEAGRRDVQFVLSGAGEQDAKWRRDAQDVPGIVFSGWLTGSQIRAMLRLAWVGLAAYSRDAPQGLPNKLFEYLSAGLPVISSLRGEAESVLRAFDCGMTYAAGDSTGLAGVLLQLLDEPGSHARLARNASRAFRDHFSAERVDEQVMNYLETIVTSPSIRPDP